MLYRTRFFLHFFAFVKDPTRTEYLFNIVNILLKDPHNLPVIEHLEKFYLENSTLKKMYEERWLPPVPTMDQLKACPAGSLGKAYFDHLYKNNIQPDFFPSRNIKRPIDYFSSRLYQCHDLWHVLLGLDISPQGELALQGFTFAQIQSGVPLIILAGGFLHVTRAQPFSLVPLFDDIVRCYQLGRRLPPLLTFPLEEMLQEPLSLVREKIGFPRFDDM